jgi:nucleotide-binding universal stress UspA family protein
MFDRILLAIDDSPSGEMATAFATALARRVQASVHVLHVNERAIGGRGLTVASPEEATELVRGAVQQLAGAGVRAAGTVRAASLRRVPELIVETAAARGADVIVLGSHRHRRLGRLLSGRVRDHATRLTSLPILTAPSPLKVTKLVDVDAWDGRLDSVLDSILQ